MEGLLALGVILVAFVVGLSVNESGQELNIIEKQQEITLQEVNSSQQFTIYWWREVYQSQLEYTQRHYVSSLSLGTGYRHVLVPYVSGYVKGFNLHNGSWEWQLKTPQQITSGVHIQGSLGVVGGEDGLIIAFDTLSGKERWRTQTNSTVISLSQGRERVYAYTRNGRAYALKEQTGEIVWNYIGKEPVSSLYGASKIHERSDRVYVGSGNGLLVALNKDDGKLLWQRNIGQARGFSDLDNIVDVDSGILTDEENIYTSYFGGKLYAINQQTQLNLWENKVSLLYALEHDTFDQFNNLDVADGSSRKKAIVALTSDSFIQAYDVRSGALLWQNKDMRFRRLGQLFKYQNYWLTIDKKGTIFAVNRNNGKLETFYKSETGLAVNPVVKGNYFYWLDRKGQLYSMFLQSKFKPDFVRQPVVN